MYNETTCQDPWFLKGIPAGLKCVQPDKLKPDCDWLIIILLIKVSKLSAILMSPTNWVKKSSVDTSLSAL